MTPVQKLVGLALAILLALTIGFGGAWQVQDWRLGTEEKLALQDQQHSKELSDAQRNQARLRDQLATADVRLSVLIEDSASGCNVPTAPGAAGVVHAVRRAQLDPAHAQRIIAITDDGDNAVIALRACQAYVRAIAK